MHAYVFTQVTPPFTSFAYSPKRNQKRGNISKVLVLLKHQTIKQKAETLFAQIHFFFHFTLLVVMTNKQLKLFKSLPQTLIELHTH